MKRLDEANESLLWLTAGPIIWAVHFGISYAAAALGCGKFHQQPESVRHLIWGITPIALILIAWTAWRGYRRHSFDGSTAPLDFDSKEARFRFLGFATVLLAGMSALATTYVAMAAVFIGSCD